jgi:hypothetical protein
MRACDATHAALGSVSRSSCRGPPAHPQRKMSYQLSLFRQKQCVDFVYAHVLNFFERLAPKATKEGRRGKRGQNFPKEGKLASLQELSRTGICEGGFSQGSAGNVLKPCCLRNRIGTLVKFLFIFFLCNRIRKLDNESVKHNSELKLGQSQICQQVLSERFSSSCLEGKCRSLPRTRC